MNEGFIDLFKQFRYLRPNDLLELYRISSFKTYKSGEIIARVGIVYPYMIGILKGVIRTFVLDSNDNERTIRLATNGDFASCARSVFKSEPSSEYLEVIEDTKVILIDMEQLKKLIIVNHRIMRVWNDGLSKAFLEATDRIAFFVALTPEERYMYLKNNSAKLFDRVQDKYLASYIGVTTVSYSRIKKRIG
ncbi:MAG: hypothetical protein Kapaf2KO_19500 [Candidatus Kapaibacteriales bacterium]